MLCEAEVTQAGRPALLVQEDVLGLCEIDAVSRGRITRGQMHSLLSSQPRKGMDSALSSISRVGSTMDSGADIGKMEGNEAR